jgi:hypothetical protein
LGVYMDVVLERRNDDGTWRGKKVIESSKDYDLFEEFGWLGHADPERPGFLQQYDYQRGWVSLGDVIELRGVPPDFDWSVIEDDDGEEMGRTPGWLSSLEFGAAVGRCLAKRGSVSQGFPELVVELAALEWPPVEQLRLVFWFD